MLGSSKFKSLEDDNSNVVKMSKFVFDIVENIVGKGENAGHQHFLLFPRCFQKPSFSGSLKVGDCVVERAKTLEHTTPMF